MTRLSLLSHSEQSKFDLPPKFNKNQRAKYFAVTPDVDEYIFKMRYDSNQIGFLLQIGYFRASGKFFFTNQFRNDDIKFVIKQLEIEDPQKALSNFIYTSRTKSTHKNKILEQMGWNAWDTATESKLSEELTKHAKKQLNPTTLIPIATQFLINLSTKKVE